VLTDSNEKYVNVLGHCLIKTKEKKKKLKAEQDNGHKAARSLNGRFLKK